MFNLNSRPIFYFAIVALFFGAILIVGPWGEFPLNDDWVYTANVLDD